MIFESQVLENKKINEIMNKVVEKKDKGIEDFNNEFR